MLGTTTQKISKAISNPSLAFQVIKRKITVGISPKEFVGTQVNRSDSDNGTYVALVQSAVQNYNIFKRFKRDPRYRDILEHVSKEDGYKFLEVIKGQDPQLLDRIDTFKENDQIGSPYVYSYPGIGQVSPTTIRYIKVASDLKKYFGSNIGDKIVEIGAGYGGQLLISDRIFKIKEYHIFDLTPVLDLITKYLEGHILNSSYRPLTLNQHNGEETYDLVISNYAFSELPSQLQMKYIEKVLSKAKKGYLTMNSGLPDSVFTNNKLSLEQLKNLLPPFDIFDEVPMTAPNNYIIVWGHKK